MPTGTIKKIIADKGFGFISMPGGKADLFFHSSECLATFDTLQQGQAVEFEEGSGPKGPKAINVKLVDEA